MGKSDFSRYNQDRVGTVTEIPGRIITRASSLVTASTRSGSVDHGELDLQPDLPKLPVPDLEKTLSRYLEAMAPVLSPSQYDKLEKIASAFAENEGPQLQSELLERQIKLPNWAYEWWLNDMYMNNPLALPVNSNPGEVWPPQQFRNGIDDQIKFAAKVCTYMLDFKDVLDRRELPIEKAPSREPGQPMCMAQHYRLFTSYRVPSIPRDFKRDTSNVKADHIVVAYKKHFYTCPIRTPNRRLTTSEICSQLKKIVLSETTVADIPIGILTSRRRPAWADDRIKLLGADDLNKQSLEEIETCHFLICLDDPLPAKIFNGKGPGLSRGLGHWAGDRDETNMLHQMLHGGGSAYNTGNRWFDKTLEFVISSDGVVGLCYEHCPAEGIGILQISDDFIAKLASGKEVEENGDAVSVEDIPVPMKLEWNLTPELKLVVKEASIEVDCLIQDTDLLVYRFTDYGKDFIKKCKVSPDVYIQLALQLAYYSLHGRMVSTYESASTRRFKLGRVDSIRSTTMEALEWVKSMAQKDLDTMEKLKRFHMAVEKQTQIMVENILGEGIDIHLLGLRIQAEELGLETPALFQDETFKIANHFALSTSQLATRCDQFMGYGAVVPDGYGVSYNPQNGSIIFCLASFKQCKDKSTAKYGQALEKGLRDMRKMLEDA